VLALSSRNERLEEELRSAAAREKALQEDLAAAKRAAAALQRSPSKLGGEGGLASWGDGVRLCARCSARAAALIFTKRKDPCGGTMPGFNPFCLPAPSHTPAALAPAASRTLSDQFEAAGIPAVPAGLAPAAAQLSQQRAAAVELLKRAAVQRRLAVVAVPLGPAGESLR
jgi:hypothetical protein